MKKVIKVVLMVITIPVMMILARCKQYVNLNPVMKSHIKVNYRKALLPHWQEIQQSVTELIYNFEAKSND